jgi:MOSC domain-containing protein YiiM
VTGVIDAVLVGRIKPFRKDGATSAIAKQPLSGRARIGPLGILGDEQADPVHHGGPDKAIHHYARDHYAAWQAEFPGHPLLEAAGAFGENISTMGLTELTVCLGDRFRVGSALVEVSHGRQPCWKLAHRFGEPTLVARVVETARCGWYYRVLEPGEAGPGDAIALAERPHPHWTIDLLFRTVISRAHQASSAELRELAGIRALAEAWRVQIVARL